MVEDIFGMIAAPRFPLVMGVLIATGIVIGGLMRENGYSVRHFLIWFLSAAAYTVGVLFGFRSVDVGTHGESEWFTVLVVVLLTGVGYMSGIAVGIKIVDRNKAAVSNGLTELERAVRALIENGSTHETKP